jgi:hypothetical protein
LYEEYLGTPLSEVSHHLLHRDYTDRSASATPENGAGCASAAAGATGSEAAA